jgi:hypothetical protein
LKEKQKLYEQKSGTALEKTKGITGLIKGVKTSTFLPELQSIEESLKACENIKRLCDQSYMICFQIQCGNKPFISEEVMDFIELSQESIRPLSNELYKKIEELKQEQNNLRK